MSRFMSERLRNIAPYDTNGEHEAGDYVRLNTNESPFPPPPAAVKRMEEAAAELNFYPDPDGRELSAKIAALYGLSGDEVLLTCGSDEALDFIFTAFCDAVHGAAFPRITYSFYKVLADLHGVPCETLPLNGDFSIPVEKYVNLGRTLFLPNPNSPTGLYVPGEEMERVIKGNPDNVVVVDEAYIDFGGESCAPLIRKYENLLVVQTFSKSRSLAGARLGFCAGRAELIRDLKAIKNSEAPYNLSSVTLAAGLGAMEDEACTRANCRAIAENRDFTFAGLRKLAFEAVPSMGNFILARHGKFTGEELAARLKERGVLVRSYGGPEELLPYIRITIGTREQMEKLLSALKELVSQKI